jgi:amidase
MSEIWKLSAVELATKIARGEVSCVDAVAAASGRIKALNGNLNAIVDDQLTDAANLAIEYDEKLNETGPIGPLHGVPVTIKVNVDQKGHPTTNGITAYKDVIATQDAPIVSNLRKAGAIIVGRTNTPEFSFRATTDNELHGRTKNPWDEMRSPGGSSGGASSAVAAGFCQIGHGNDIGGSLRFPSFMCGLTTIRPTQGRVPAFNSTGEEERSLLAQLMSTQGVIAREVRDLRLGTKIVAMEDPRDPWWVPAPFDGPAIDGPVKVAVTKDSLGYNIDPAILAAIDKSASILSDAGYAVEEVDPPMAEEIADAVGPSLFGDARIFIDSAVRQHGSETIRRMFNEYYEFMGSHGPEDLLRAMAKRSYYTRAWSVFLSHYPLILTPFLMRPTYEWDEDARGLEQLKDIFDAGKYSYMMNYLGLPAAVISTGLHDDLPIGVQIVGRRYREDLCLDAIETIEQRVGVMIHNLWNREG